LTTPKPQQQYLPNQATPSIVVPAYPPIQLEEVFHLNPQPPMPTRPKPTLANTRAVPSAPPRRSSSAGRDEEFLTSDHTVEGEIQLDFWPLNADDELKRRKQMEDEEELRKQFSQLKLNELKEKLCKKCPIGPMDAKNRKIYETKLAKLEAGQSQKERNGDKINRKEN